MEICHYKVGKYDLYVSRTDKFFVNAMENSNILTTVISESGITLKNMNLFLLKFVLKTLSHYDLKNDEGINLVLQECSKFSNMFLRLNYDIKKEILILLFKLIAKLNKLFIKFLVRNNEEFLIMYCDLLIIKSYLNFLITN